MTLTQAFQRLGEPKVFAKSSLHPSPLRAADLYARSRGWQDRPIMDKPIRVVVTPSGQSRMRDVETTTNGVATTDADTCAVD